MSKGLAFICDQDTQGLERLARVPEIHGRQADDFQADLERLVRAYDPCQSCSTHLLTIEQR
ncbi:MAG: hypothetical protein C0616_00355 [Desulfuromonas sp.]|nr:MAG: hypothetical protein C0616_00355 [Desulfuromonas sp.]